MKDIRITLYHPHSGTYIGTCLITSDRNHPYYDEILEKIANQFHHRVDCYIVHYSDPKYANPSGLYFPKLEN